MKPIKLTSFSYRNGAPPKDATTIIDCRPMRNPHHVMSLRPLDGRSLDVQDYVGCDPLFRDMRQEVLRACVKTSPTGMAPPVSIAFGCFGGRHRSVALAEMSAKMLRDLRLPVELSHTELSA